MVIETNKALVQRWADAINQRSFAELGEFVADNMINHADVSGASGLTGFRRTLEILAESIPDQRMDVVELIAEGDTVVARTVWSGTPIGLFLGRPTTGRSFRVDHAHTFRIQNGKIAEHWGVRDDLGMLRQLGFLPEGS